MTVRKEPTLDSRRTPPEARRPAGRAADGPSGGAEGNERLTALTGAELLLLLAAEGVTILPRLGGLLAAESRSGHRAGGHADYTAAAVAVVGGRGLRLSLLAASLLAGLVIALFTVHLAAPWHFARFH